MSLKFIFLCFFLAVKTNRGVYLTNCTTEKHLISIVKYEDDLTEWKFIFLEHFLNSFISNTDTDFERVQVTCMKYDQRDEENCPEGCKGILPHSKFPFNISCVPPKKKDWLINHIRETQTISVHILHKYAGTIEFIFSAHFVFSKHTFMLAHSPFEELYQGLTWVKQGTLQEYYNRPKLICTDCRPGWISFINPMTKTIESCYFVQHLNGTRSLTQAGDLCQNKQGNIVTIETESEFQFVQDLLKKTLDASGPETWCKQQNNSVCLALNLTRHGKHFRWGQGRPLVISPPLSPNLEESGDCVTWVLSRDITGHNGEWRQVDCNVRDRYLVICEVETFLKRNSRYLAMGNEFIKHNQDIVSVAAYLEDDTFYRRLIDKMGYGIRRFNCVDESKKSIAYSFVCDNKQDCPDGRDEEFCTGDKNKQRFYNSTQRNFKRTDGSNTRQCDKIKHPPRVDLKQLLHELCNSQSDVYVLFENKINVTNTVLENRTLSALWPDILACSEGPTPVKTIGSNQTCVMAPKCLYIKSCEGYVIGCHNMIHLQNCTTFKCPSGYTKCPLSYCIPETYVNDGTQDCPEGEDENLKLKCFNTSQYVFLENVCDGSIDCPNGDDEINCNIECSYLLKCVAGIAIAPIRYFKFSDTQKYIIRIDYSIRYLVLESLMLEDEFSSITIQLGNTSKLTHLYCSSTNIKSDNFNFLSISKTNNINLAYFRYNRFQEITSTGFFSNLKRLKTLDLSYSRELTTFNLTIPSLESLDLSNTEIPSLDRKIFEKMKKLKNLYLKNTKLTNLNFIPKSFKLETLDISGTNMQGIGSNYFNNLNITGVVRTSQYKLCCPQALGPNIPVEKCESKDKSISSCTDLVRDVSMRSILWAIGLLALLGNVFALVYRMIWDRKVLQTVYGLFVSNLCISDMIMGFYLIIIGVADDVYRDSYFVREEEWKSGVVCQVAGFLSTLSSEVTTFFICLITLDRFLTLRFQTGKYRFTTRTKRASIILSWLLGFSLALVPVLCPEWGIFTSNSMCLAFPLDTAVSGGRYYAVALFLGLNFVLFLSIIVGQIFILRSLSARRSVSTFSTVNNSRRIQDVLVARQLSLVAVTNFLAWVPVQVMGTLALAGVELDNDVYTWTAVFVLPLNSALNPLVYSFPRLYSLFLSLKNSCRK